MLGKLREGIIKTDAVPFVALKGSFKEGWRHQKDEFFEHFQIRGAWGVRSALFNVCLDLIFSIQLLKKHGLNPEITILYQFHDQKALFEVPKICNIIL